MNDTKINTATSLLYPTAEEIRLLEDSIIEVKMEDDVDLPKASDIKRSKFYMKSLLMARALAYATKKANPTSADYNALSERMRKLGTLLDTGFTGFGNELTHSERQEIRAQAKDELVKYGFTNAANNLDIKTSPWWKFWGKS